MGFFDDIVKDINDSISPQAQTMGSVFTQFIRDSGAVWHVDAFMVGLGAVVLGARIRNLEAGWEGVELMAAAQRGPSVRILRKRGWGLAAVPPWVMALTQMPTVSLDPTLGVQTQSDEPEPSVLAALEPSWEQVVRTTPYTFLASDGRGVTAQIAPPLGVASIHAVAGAVAALAMSSPIAATLAALDHASPTQGGDLSPSVSLAPDGLQVGIANGPRMIARLGGISAGREPNAETRQMLARAGDPTLAVVDGVATLAWPGVERDVARLRAGVEALRSLARAAVPYR